MFDITPAAKCQEGNKPYFMIENTRIYDIFKIFQKL